MHGLDSHRPHLQLGIVHSMMKTKSAPDYPREFRAKITSGAGATLGRPSKKLPGIKGGRKGLVDAIHAAFYGRPGKVHNPVIRYSHTRGFHVESRMHPPDQDVLWEHKCHFWAATGRPNIKPTQYGEVREAIIPDNATVLQRHRSRWSIAGSRVPARCR